MPMSSFFLIRHGETDWNKVRRFQGHSDIPLNEDGIAQALKLKPALAQLQIQVWYSSDLGRAIQTAELLTGGTHPIYKEPGIRELFLGQAEGLTKEAIAEMWPEVWTAWQSLLLKDWYTRFPAGESRIEMLERFEDGLKQSLRKHAGKTVALVSHGGAIRSLVHKLCPHMTEPYLIPNCAVVPFSFDGENFKFQGPPSSELLLAPGNLPQ